MMYAATCTTLFQKADVAGKVFDLVDAEKLSLEWIVERTLGTMTRQ